MPTYTLFFYYRQPPRYRFDAVPLLVLYAGCVGTVQVELAAHVWALKAVTNSLRGGFKVRAHVLFYRPPPPCTSHSLPSSQRTAGHLTFPASRAIDWHGHARALCGVKASRLS